MKGFGRLKTIQLIVLIAAAVVAVVMAVSDHELFQMIGEDPHVGGLCAMLWVVLGLSFVFLYLDLRIDRGLRKENEELSYAFSTDQETGVANRNSCDAFIDQYTGKKPPEKMAAVTAVLDNLGELNREYGYDAGDAALGDFAQILQDAVPEGDFVGRNGGDKFLMILESCGADEKEALLGSIRESVDRYNDASGGRRISYSIGCALQSERDEKSLPALVAVSDREAYSMIHTGQKQG